MRSSLPHKHPIASNAIEDEPAGALTRRTVLTGAAAATAAATVGATLDTPAHAQSVDVNSQEDMELFVWLSSALTGIPATKLAPGSDPVNVKREYLTRANERCPAALENLLRLARKNRDAPDHIIDALKFDDDDKNKTPSDVEAKYLARSIVLMWYLGAWYEPDELKALRKDLPKDPTRVPKFEVVSPKAYTQAWALRVAQAHPMGFSEMQFGYWTRPPNPRTV
jgi:Membrane bound FAD containing D-sorbitol dehydrogenase